MPVRKKILHILGPTGVGKSEIAIQLAEKFHGEIISADAFQVYSGFDIGTDKVSVSRRRNIPHHLVDIIDDCAQFNAWNFLQLSFQAAEEIIQRGKLPIVCGGTALYLSVQIKGIFPEKKDDGEVRRQLQKELMEKGLQTLWEELRKVDPEYAQKIGPNDRIRTLRGLEILRLNGIPPSEIFRQSRSPFHDYQFLRIGLDLPRQELYIKINQRVDRMMNSGLLQEVQFLQRYKPSKAPPFRALGYRELIDYGKGLIPLEKAIELIKQNSRRLAKRQLTWFRHEKDIHWFTPHESKLIEEFVGRHIWNDR